MVSNWTIWPSELNQKGFPFFRVTYNTGRDLRGPSLQVYRKTRRDRLKSAPYLRLKNIQRTTIGNIWKNYFFQKNFWKLFFEKKYFFRKSYNAEKLKKRPFRLIKRFYKPKTSKKCKGLPFDRVRKFSKKSRIVPKKTQRGDPLFSPAILLEA